RRRDTAGGEQRQKLVERVHLERGRQLAQALHYGLYRHVGPGLDVEGGGAVGRAAQAIEHVERDEDARPHAVLEDAGEGELLAQERNLLADVVMGAGGLEIVGDHLVAAGMEGAALEEVEAAADGIELGQVDAADGLRRLSQLV